VIYLDTSVVLAAVFSETRRPRAAFWQQPMISSRLLEYELHVRCLARGAAPSVVEAVLARVALAEMTPQVLARVLQPFPTSVRTLDAMHLATAVYLQDHGQRIEVATYDARMAKASTALGLSIWDENPP
jgi:predicted nucleic acid-binding protein